MEKARYSQETLEYIQAMTDEMATMAKRENCEVVAYLLELASIEASKVLRASQSAGGHD